MSDRDPEFELATNSRGRSSRAPLHTSSPSSVPPASYFDDPDRALRRGSMDEMLGCGAESMTVLTPYALAIAQPVAQLLMNEISKEATARGKEAVLSLVRRMFGRKAETTASGSDEAEIEPLNREQLARVRELALRKGRELDLDETRAALLADAMVGSLGSRLRLTRDVTLISSRRYAAEKTGRDAADRTSPSRLEKTLSEDSDYYAAYNTKGSAAYEAV